MVGVKSDTGALPAWTGDPVAYTLPLASEISSYRIIVTSRLVI